MKIRRNDFSNLRQLRASSCWSSSAGRNSTPTHLVDFIRWTEQSGDNRHSFPETVQFGTRKNKPGHVTPRSNDIPPRKPFSSFPLSIFRFAYFSFPSYFFHFSTQFKDPRGKKLYFVQDTRDIIINAKIFLHNFTRSFLLHYWTLGKLKLKISRTYIICWRKTLLCSKERRKFIISMNRNKIARSKEKKKWSSDEFTVSNYDKGMRNCGK